MRSSRSSMVVASVILAGLLLAAAPRSAQAQCYSYLSSPGYIVTPGYYVSSPAYLAPVPVYIAPGPVYAGTRVVYQSYPSYVTYRSYYPGYYPGHYKRYYQRPYYRGTSVGFSFGYHHR